MQLPDMRSHLHGLAVETVEVQISNAMCGPTLIAITDYLPNIY